MRANAATKRKHLHPDGIDLNRGAVGLKADGPDAPRVWTYPDTPGEYFNYAGFEMTLEEAEAAGHDTQGDAKAAAKRRLSDSIMAKAEAKLQQQAAELDGMSADDILAKIQEEDDTEPELPKKTDSQLITRRTSVGAPRGTEFHFLEHIGAKKWRVRAEGTGEIVMENVGEDVAVDYIINEAEKVVAIAAAASQAETAPQPEEATNQGGDHVA